MEIKLFPGSRYRIQKKTADKAEIFFLGILHDNPDDVLERLDKICLINGQLRTAEDIAAAVNNLKGNFGFIIKDRDNRVLAGVDKIRSYPIFYCRFGNSLHIGFDSTQVLENQTPALVPLSLLEFKMAGYVTGHDTLMGGLQQLQAGEFLYVDHDRYTIERYYQFYAPSPKHSQEEWVAKLHETTLDIFKRLVARLNGRPVLVPLSAGLDSRLIVCMLKLLGYDNFKTFSYGLPGNHEARWAKEVARRLGLDWFFVPYSRKAARAFFSSSTYAQYAEFSHGYYAVPFFQDILALAVLRDKQQLVEDAVVINGQTGDFISGDHIPHTFVKPILTDEEVLAGIIKKHYSLWTHLHTPENLARIKEKIKAVMPILLPETMTQEQAVKWYELWEWHGRQTKYVINGQRAYDFFGLSWELPLWDDEYLKFWAQVPAQYKLKQYLYREYLKQYDVFGLFQNLPTNPYIVPAPMRYLQRIFARFGPRGVQWAKILLSYWQNFSYYYALYSYRSYLPYARFHRHGVSYHAKYILEQSYGIPLNGLIDF